jgi:predicted ATP-dependent Lon-type protease
MDGYIPGWEIPEITPSMLAQGVGFVSDYFGEILATTNGFITSRFVRTASGKPN